MMTYGLTFVLAFCSIVYELLLGQSLSAFLGNTVLRYSVTIGLYLFSMGIGSLLTENRLLRNPVLTLLKIETLLTCLGGFALVILHAFSLSGMPSVFFSAGAHGLIVIIGILSGAEIPLLIAIREQEKSGTSNFVLGIDYIGAFLGTILFAFVFYPRVGLMPTAFFIGLLNAAAGLALITKKSQLSTEFKQSFLRYWWVQSICFVILFILLINVMRINDYFMNKYMGL